MGRLLLIIFSILATVSCNREAAKKEYVERGNRYFAEGKYRDAVLMYRKAIKKDNTFGEAHYRLGLTEIRLGKFTNGAISLRRSMSLMPGKDDSPRVELANLLLSAYSTDPNRVKKLAEEVRTLIKPLLEKKSYDGYRLDGQLALVEGRLPDALQSLNEANAIKPLEPDVTVPLSLALVRSNDADSAERLAIETVEKHKTAGPAYEVLYSVYVSRKRMPDAEKVLEGKVANNPAQVEYRLQLAAHYAGAQKPERMEEILSGILNNPKQFPLGHENVGDFYAGVRLWDKATAQFQQCMAAYSSEKLACQKRIVKVLLVQGKGQDAAAMVDTILREHPKDKDLRSIHSGLLMESGNAEKIKQAIASYKQLIADFPNDPVVRFQCGRANLALRQTDEARLQFLEAVRIGKYRPALQALAELSLATQQYRDSLKYAEELSQAGPENIQVRLIHSASLIGLQRYPQASSELNQFLRDHPGLPAAAFQVAMLEFARQNFTEAEAGFKKLYATNPKDLRPLEGLVQLYAAQNEIGKAQALLEGELRKRPEEGALRLLLANVAAATRNNNLAAQQYRELLAKNPDSAELYYRLGNVVMQSGDSTEGMANLERARQIDPRSIRYALAQGSALEQSGRIEEAHAVYQQANRLEADNPLVLNNLAFTMAETGGNLDEALKLIQRAMQKMPQEPHLSDTLGWIYAKKKMNDSALQIFRNLVRKYPDDPTYRYHLGSVLLNQGDKRQAKAELEAALEKKPSKQEEASIRQLLQQPAGWR